MDVANYAKAQGMTAAVVQARADMGSWAGDIADLMFCAENVDIPRRWIPRRRTLTFWLPTFVQNTSV